MAQTVVNNILLSIVSYSLLIGLLTELVHRLKSLTSYIALALHIFATQYNSFPRHEEGTVMLRWEIQVVSLAKLLQEGLRGVQGSEVAHVHLY